MKSQPRYCLYDIQPKVIKVYITVPTIKKNDNYKLKIKSIYKGKYKFNKWLKLMICKIEHCVIGLTIGFNLQYN